MDQSERYPVDYDAIEAGHVISRSRLAVILGERPGSHTFRYKLTALQRQVEQELWDRGKQLTVAQDHGDLLILDGVAASRHNRRRSRQYARRFARSHRRLMAVDVGKLSEEERREHDRALVVQGAMLAGLVAGRGEGLRIAHRRNTPGLPQPEGQATEA